MLQKRVKIFLQLLIFSLLLWGPCAFSEGNSPRFSLYPSTDRDNPANGGGEKLRLEFHEVDGDKVGDLLTNLRSVLPPVDAKHPPIVPLYIAAGRPHQEVNAMVMLAQQQFEKAFPGVKPKIEVRYFGDPKKRLEAEAMKVDEIIDQLAASMPQDSDTQEGATALKEANKLALKKALEGPPPEASRLTRILNLPSAKNFIRLFSTFKAGLSLLSHGTQAIQGGGSGGPVGVAAGLTLVAGDAAFKYYYARYQQEADRWMAGHGLPLPKDNILLQKLNRFYAQNPAMQWIKSTAVGVLGWGMIHPILLQSLAHLNNPEKVRAVTMEDAFAFSGIALAANLFYTGGLFGFRDLQKRQWISQAVGDVGLRLATFLHVAAGLVMASGRPEVQFLLYPILGTAWTGLGSVYLTSLGLRSSRARYAMVDSAITDKKDIEAIHSLESTLKIRSPISDPEAIIRQVNAYAPKQERKCSGALAWLGSRLRRLQPIGH